MSGNGADAAASIWRAWVNGRCPCCGAALDSWEWQGAVTEPAAIGEGVMMCGRCIANEHGRESVRFVPVLLECIAARTDAPMERLLDEIDQEVGAGFQMRAYLGAVHTNGG